jgi:hypothetical protein
MLNSSGFAVPNALPFEEVLQWNRFSTLADVYDLKNLGSQLECLTPQVGSLDLDSGTLQPECPPVLNRFVNPWVQARFQHF